MHALAETLPLERMYEKAREDFEGIVAYADSEEAAFMSHWPRWPRSTACPLGCAPPRNIIGEEANHRAPPGVRAARKQVWAKLEKGPEEVIEGAETVLRLRALRASHDFDEYWAFHEAREYERNHQALYEDGHVPSTVKPHLKRRRPRLKSVK